MHASSSGGPGLPLFVEGVPVAGKVLAAHLQKKRLSQVICRRGRSYLDGTKKSATPSRPTLGSRYEMALSTAEWKGGITAVTQAGGQCCCACSR